MIRKKINKCSKCGGGKELSIARYCKICRNEYAREYYRNSSKCRARVKEYHKKYDREYYLKNAERIKTRGRNYKHRNKKKEQKYKRRKYLENREKNREITNQKSLEYYHERKVRICQGNIKTQKEALILLRILLAQTERALRTGNREALCSLKKKYEQLPTMAA